MNRIAVRIPVLVAAVVLVQGPAEVGYAFCLSSTSGQNSCCNSGTFGCKNLRWNQRCISVGVEQSGSRDLPTEAVDQIIDRSFLAWMNVQCRDGETSRIDVRRLVERSQCNVPEFNPEGGNINSIGFVSDWSARGNDPNAFALTSVFFNRTTGEILDADIEVNQEQLVSRGEVIPLAWGVCPFPEGCDNTGQSPVIADLEATMTHEAGHFLGLGHTDDTLATMFPSASAGTSSGRVLAADDENGFCAVYPPGQPEGGCDFSPQGGLVTECGGVRDCGCSVLRPRDIPGPALLCLLVAGLMLRRSPLKGRRR